MNGYLTTIEVARIFGVSSRTILFWHRRKLLLPDYVTAGGHRRYLDSNIKKMLKCKPSPENQVVYPIVYSIQNINNNKRYIGSTIDKDERRKHHFSLLRNNKHPNQHLQLSFNKYGSGQFVFEIICFCEEQDMLLLEKFYMEKFHACDRRLGYNIKLDPVRLRHSKETKRKISESLKGHTISEETRRKMRTKKMGNKNRGTKPLSDESRKKISRALTGRKQSSETIKKRNKSRAEYHKKKIENDTSV